MSLKTRSITGIIFGAIMIGGTIAHAYSCAALFLLVGICCLWEYGGLVLAKDSPEPFTGLRKLLAVIVGLLPLLWVWPQTQPYAIGALPLAFGLFIFELFAKSAKPFDNLGFLALGALYIGVPTALVESLCLLPNGNQLVMAMLAIVWVSDSFAYLFGSRIGKTPFFPRISPKKTWEGTLCGLAGALLMGWICQLIFPSLPFVLWQWLILAAVGSIFGILGDLIESMLKRSLGIKDSGTILPGHGGFLDRFDAFIFLVPFVYFAMYLLA